MRRENFAAGMAKLDVLPRRDPSTAAEVKVHAQTYLEALRDLSEDQWAHAVNTAVRLDRWYPQPVRLRELAGLAGTPPSAMAGRVYDQIVEAYAAGDKLSYGQVHDRFGEAAEDAFVAAGGRRAFEWCEPSGEPFRRRDFIACWKESVAAVPARALPPPKVPQLAQPSVVEPERPKGGAGLTPEAILAEIKKRAEAQGVGE